MLTSEQNGCYRITLVLPSHDYLSISPANTQHILIPTTPSPRQLAPHIITHHQRLKTIKMQQHILTPKECIEVDNVKYLVVDIDDGEVQTGLKMKPLSKRLTIKIFRQTVRGVLEQLLWLEVKEVKQYLDIRNFVLVGETMFFMLSQRARIRTNSLPRSEKRFSMPVASSLESVLENELIVIRQFGLILWEIVHQKAYRRLNDAERIKSNENDGLQWINVLLQQMISKKATMEHINRILDDNVEGNRGNRVKARVVSRSEERSMNTSGDSVGFNRGSMVEIGKKRYSILENSRRLNENTYSRKTNLQSRLYTQSNDSQSCLTRQKSSLISLSDQLRSSYKHPVINPKLERQNIQALQKFNRVVNSHKQQSDAKEIKIDDQKLKIKLIDRLNKLKMSANPPIDRNLNERMGQINKGNEKIEAVTRKLQFDEQQKLPQKEQGNVGLDKKIEIVDITKDIKLQEPILIERNIQKVTKKRQNNFIMRTSSTVSQESNASAVGNIGNLSIKTQISESISIADNSSPLQSGPNLKISQSKDNKKISILNPHDDQIEEIVLERNSKTKPLPLIKKQSKKEEQQAAPPSSPQTKQEKTKSLILSPKQKSIDLLLHIEQYLNMINLLGNLCVKAFKSKQKLSKIEWEKSIYFLYERFYFERKKLLQCYRLDSPQIIRKRTQTISENEWKKWSESQKRQQLINQLTNQNQRIFNDLNKFAQKLLKVAKLERKMELYIRKRQHYMNQPSKRIELSKLAVICILDQYDNIITNRLNSKDVIDHMLDCLFGLQIIAELDDLAPPAVRPKLQQYQNYLYDLKASNDLMEALYGLYVDPEQR